MFGFGKKKTDIAAPFAGSIVEVTKIPDPVFAEKMLGEGFAVIPDEGVETLEVCAPATGRLLKVFKTLHAFAMVSEEGTEILVHIGLETVELGGAPFEALAESGDEVVTGQPIIRVDVASIRQGGRNPITPVVFSKAGQVEEVSLKARHADAAGDIVCSITRA